MNLNPANQLTLLRLVLVVPFLVFTIEDNVYTRIAALLIFIVASITDLIDGQIARRMNMVTKLGIFLDPLADKLLISAAFIAFVQIREIYVPAWMVVLIIGREFLITGLRTLAVSQGRVLAAQPAGKFKTTSQIISIITIMLILIANSSLEAWFHTPKDALLQMDGWKEWIGFLLKWGAYWLTFLTTLFTIVSGYLYLRDHIDLVNE